MHGQDIHAQDTRRCKGQPFAEKAIKLLAQMKSKACKMAFQIYPLALLAHCLNFRGFESCAVLYCIEHGLAWIHMDWHGLSMDWAWIWGRACLSTKSPPRPRAGPAPARDKGKGLAGVAEIEALSIYMASQALHLHLTARYPCSGKPCARNLPTATMTS